MKQTNISNLKAHLSQFLEYVREGGTVRVYDRDRPVAELIPWGLDRPGEKNVIESVLDALDQQGVVRRGRGDARKLLPQRLPVPQRSAVEALIEERREGR